MNRSDPNEPVKPVQLDRTIQANNPSHARCRLQRPPATSRFRTLRSGHHGRSPTGWTTPGPAGPNQTSLGSNHGRMKEIKSREAGAPARPRDVPPSTPTAKPGSTDRLATLLPQHGPP
ncbi:hypothetical protein F511_20133 [Dorcoceras hygrometricum]|uniref:Uncharacterized protein n=1 Tax=Dorcoceras hygrometricum TaxID=472368 RepID=A0A2Z7BQP0_9LAMI|nr:hypothetical protein F511_20133 [Dorcoceras hygrometricum]